MLLAQSAFGIIIIIIIINYFLNYYYYLFFKIIIIIYFIIIIIIIIVIIIINSVLKVGNWPVNKSELTSRFLKQFIRYKYINSIELDKINHSNEQM